MSLSNSDPLGRWHLLPLTASTHDGLERAADELWGALRHRPRAPVARVARALHLRSRPQPHRLVVLGRNAAEVADAFEQRDSRFLRWAEGPTADRPAAFTFPGLGEQYPQMGGDLYRTMPAYRAQIDRCCDLLVSAAGLDLRPALLPEEHHPDTANAVVDPRDDRRDLATLLFAQPAGWRPPTASPTSLG